MKDKDKTKAQLISELMVLRRQVAALETLTAEAKAAPQEFVEGQLESRRRQAEETLRTERNLLRTVIDNIPDAIYIKNRESGPLLSKRRYFRA